MTDSPEWLIRMSTNRIEGPFTKTQLLSMLEKGALNSQDEICQGNSYWISLRDQAEVERNLGSNVIIQKSDDPEEDTTATDLIRTNEQFEGNESTAVHSLSSLKKKSKVPGTAKEKPDPYSSTVGGGVSVQQGLPLTQPTLIRPKLGLKKNVESPSVWKIVLAVLVILAAFLFGVLLRLVEPTTPTKPDLTLVAPTPLVEKK